MQDLRRGAYMMRLGEKASVGETWARRKDGKADESERAFVPTTRHRSARARCCSGVSRGAFDAPHACPFSLHLGCLVSTGED